jgi:hypothetical protein
VKTSLAWEEANGRYLSAALRWLRHLLAQRIETAQAADESAAEAIAEMDEIAAMMIPPPALMLLADRFGLSRFEQDILLMCAAVELDTRIAPLCAQAQGDPSRPYPTFALALAALPDGAWDAASPGRPLRYWRLLEVNQAPGQPLTTGALRADERIVNYIKGLNGLDERLLPFLERLDEPDPSAALPRSTEATMARIAEPLQRSTASSALTVLQLLGSDPDSKRLAARLAVARMGCQLYRLPIGLVPDQVGEVETLARLWHRETLLLPVALYLDAEESDGPTPAEAPRVDRFLSRSSGLILLASREAWPTPGRGTAVVDVARPTADEQAAVWAEALGGAGGEMPLLLASQFDLSLPGIEEVLATKPLDAEQLWGACLAATRPRMESLAERLDAKATWNEIVLPAAESKALHQLADQVRYRGTVYDGWGFRRKMARGLGISALFAGPSGSGKTMAAEVLANELGLSLYRIDLSAVVSKYIGETEKNLRKLFDGAEYGGLILFFDEADALFGKRTEVKDSHDRFANVEINYLLQRMEAYRGLAILATNLKSALDPAFVRRLRFIVDFPFPAAAQRRLIWERVFPPEAPVADLDLDQLARFNLTGGSIHNVALNAAFLAAASGSEITMVIVLEAVRTEFRKLEKPINEADFQQARPTRGAAA